MANPNTPRFMASAATSEQKVTPKGDSNLNMLRPAMKQQNQSSLDGPVAVLWDIENCRVPSDVCPEDVAGNIRMALQGHPVINGAVKMFSAYGDFNSFPKRLREGCQRTGVKLIDLPNGRKDAADKAILVDMFLFALDNPSPSSIMLISGDVDFAPALHILGQRGYTVILVIPSGVGVSSALYNAGKYVWDWPSVARGEGFVPPSKALKHLRGGPTELDGYFMGCHINDNLDGQNEDESIIYGGISPSYNKLRDFSIMSQSSSEYTSNPSITGPTFPANISSHNLPSRLIEASGCPVSYDDNDSIWEHPGDINGLKGQLVKLLESSGGCLLLTCVPAVYQKMYGRPLYCSKYGAFKLADLFKKMGDVMAIDGKGQKKLVYLRNWKASPNLPPVVLARKKKKGKDTQEDNMDFAPGGGSSDDYSDEEWVAVEEQDDRWNPKRISFGSFDEERIAVEEQDDRWNPTRISFGSFDEERMVVEEQDDRRNPTRISFGFTSKEKGTREENIDFAPDGSFSDEERMAVEKRDDRRNPMRISFGSFQAFSTSKEKGTQEENIDFAPGGRSSGRKGWQLKNRMIGGTQEGLVMPAYKLFLTSKEKGTREENIHFAPGGGSSNGKGWQLKNRMIGGTQRGLVMPAYKRFLTSKEKGAWEENIDFAPGDGSFDGWE